MALIQFPYTNFHDLNLDWLLNELKELEARVSYIEELLEIEPETDESEEEVL